MALHGNEAFLVGGPAYTAETPVGVGSSDHSSLSAGVGGGTGIKKSSKYVFIYYIILCTESNCFILKKKKTEAQSLAFWKGMVNKSLPLYKGLSTQIQ